MQQNTVLRLLRIREITEIMLSLLLQYSLGFVVLCWKAHSKHASIGKVSNIHTF